MTLQESARTKAVWAAKVAALFVLAGGAVGGAVIGIVFPIITLMSRPAPQFDAVGLAQLPMVVLMTSLLGILVGLPASACTAGAYVAVPAARKLWRILCVGVLASGFWGAIIVEGLTTGPATLENYAIVVGSLSLVGGVATVVCFWLLKRWRLRKPMTL